MMGHVAKYLVLDAFAVRSHLRNSERCAAAGERSYVMAFGYVMQYQAAVWRRSLVIAPAHALLLINSSA